MLSSLKTHSPRARNYPRLNVLRTVVLRVWGHEIETAATSLSFSGAFLEGKINFPIGTQLEIAVNDGRQPVTAKARVVHNHGNGIGVAFVDPPEDFLDELYETVHRQVVQNVKDGHHEDTVPGRIALLYRGEQGGHHVLFTSHLSPHGVWVLDENPADYPDTFWVTLPDRGLYDSQCRVEWRREGIMGLSFINPADEFSAAYQRVLAVFLGDG